MTQFVLSNSSFVCIGYQNLVSNNMQTYLGNENFLNIKVFDTIHHKYNSIITCTSETYLIQMSEL